MNIIKLCAKKDLNQLMFFIGKFWKKKHILAKNKKFFNWQFYNSITKKYNFLICIKNKKIVGCLGFIPNSQYSKFLKGNDTYWLVNWLTIKNSSNSLSLLSRIFKKSNMIGTTGNSQKTGVILKKLGFKTGYLNHWYFINSNKRKFNLVKSKISFKNRSKKNIDYHIKKISQLKKLNEVIIKNSNKDFIFFINRYFKHPIYKYEFYGIFHDKKLKSFFVTRICSFKKNYAIRIVDYMGNLNNFYNLHAELIKLLESKNAEYIDFYEYGASINRKNFPFKLNNFKKEIIVPNYYEPFVKKNIKIRFAYMENLRKLKIFKGDCDQDRPS